MLDNKVKVEQLSDEELDKIIGGAAVPIFPEAYPAHIKAQGQQDGNIFRPMPESNRQRYTN